MLSRAFGRIRNDRACDVGGGFERASGNQLDACWRGLDQIEDVEFQGTAV